MAKAESVITIKSEVRPCVILPDLKRALWHSWVKYGRGMERWEAEVAALVEYEGGSVNTINPNLILFLDSRGKFDEYIWPEGCAHDGD